MRKILYLLLASTLLFGSLFSQSYPDSSNIQNGRQIRPADLLQLYRVILGKGSWKAKTLSADTVNGVFVGTLSGNVTGDVIGNISGNAATATLATTATLAAAVTNGVYTTGSQSIGGVKTFSSKPIFVSGVELYGGLNDGTLSTSELTATRAWTLPDATGTIVVSNAVGVQENSLFQYISGEWTNRALTQVANDLSARKFSRYYEEFASYNAITVNIANIMGAYSWYPLSSNGGGSYAVGVPSAGTLGTRVITTAATANQNMRLYPTGTNSTNGLILGNSQFIYNASVKNTHADSTSKYVLVGLVNDHDVSNSNGIYFYGSNTDGYVCITKSNDITKSTQTAVAQSSSSFTNFGIVSTGTSVAFYINNVLVATHTENIIQTAVHPAFMIYATASVARIMEVDFVDLMLYR